ncbi:hypothetical protein [Deinococcus budaensis]|uniref:Uncharacterized protein n=1 Tax=Deinococcus budaensis TaxID=1665626 RepID=A0A7W8GIW2_9DEIO|nr:hypothetical protein [Deinococcus budaensis]MBB5235966.1 hypothetical protein [Deinococcus budaensis]
MSAEGKKAGRFSGLDSIRSKPEAAVPVSPPAASLAVAEDKSAKPEPFSSHLRNGTKRRLRQAAAREDRKLFETLEQAVEEYLSKHHPDIRE